MAPAEYSLSLRLCAAANRCEEFLGFGGDPAGKESDESSARSLRIKETAKRECPCTCRADLHANVGIGFAAEKVAESCGKERELM